MKLNNIWGYGQLFGYSGLDGVNRYYNDFIGTLTGQERDRIEQNSLARSAFAGNSIKAGSKLDFSIGYQCQIFDFKVIEHSSTKKQGKRLFSHFPVLSHQSRPAFSANPMRIFMHWIAWPEAPLVRLSIQLVTISLLVLGSML